MWAGGIVPLVKSGRGSPRFGVVLPPPRLRERNIGAISPRGSVSGAKPRCPIPRGTTPPTLFARSQDVRKPRSEIGDCHQFPEEPKGEGWRRVPQRAGRKHSKKLSCFTGRCARTCLSLASPAPKAPDPVGISCRGTMPPAPQRVSAAISSLAPSALSGSPSLRAGPPTWASPE